MVKRAVCVMSVLLVALFSPVAMGSLFVNPPENYMSDYEWQTPFPYQRNAMIDFKNNPQNWTADPVQGYDLQPAPDLSNYDLEGTEDLLGTPPLYESDWLDIDGAFAWSDTDIFLGTARQGILYFLNGGSTKETVSLTWNLDNLLADCTHKHIWSELIFLMSAGTDLDINIIPQPGTQLMDLRLVVMDPAQLGDGWIIGDGYGRIDPNPYWEQLVLTATLDPGELFAVDSWHTATECVPEPATGALFGLGLVALGIRRRRREA